MLSLIQIKNPKPLLRLVLPIYMVVAISACGGSDKPPEKTSGTNPNSTLTDDAGQGANTGAPGTEIISTPAVEPNTTPETPAQGTASLTSSNGTETASAEPPVETPVEPPAEPPVTSSIEVSALKGIWSFCKANDSGNSTLLTYAFVDARYTLVSGTFANNACSGAPDGGFIEKRSGNFELGEQILSSDGMSARVVDLNNEYVDGSLVAPAKQKATYTIYSFENDMLYFGDSTGDSNALTPETRPTALLLTEPYATNADGPVGEHIEVASTTPGTGTDVPPPVETITTLPATDVAGYLVSAGDPKGEENPIVGTSFESLAFHCDGTATYTFISTSLGDKTVTDVYTVTDFTVSVPTSKETIEITPGHVVPATVPGEILLVNGSIVVGESNFEVPVGLTVDTITKVETCK